MLSRVVLFPKADHRSGLKEFGLRRGKFRRIQNGQGLAGADGRTEVLEDFAHHSVGARRNTGIAIAVVGHLGVAFQRLADRAILDALVFQSGTPGDLRGAELNALLTRRAGDIGSLAGVSRARDRNKLNVGRAIRGRRGRGNRRIAQGAPRFRQAVFAAPVSLGLVGVYKVWFAGPAEGFGEAVLLAPAAFHSKRGVAKRAG